MSTVQNTATQPQATPTAAVATQPDPKAQAPETTQATAATAAKAETAPAPKPEDQKSVTPSETVVPEKYDLAFPEGSKLHAKAIEESVATYKQHGFSQEQAKAALLLQNDAVVKHEAEQQAALEQKTKVEWVNEIKAEWGEKHVENANISSQAVDKFATPSFKQLLDTTGLGNHPEWLRFTHKVGLALQPDTFVQPGRPGEPQKSMEERWYGSKSQ